jgi:hypothetical protein
MLMFRDKYDISALARFSQYLISLEYFIKNPFGLGIGYASFPNGYLKFDSAFFSIIVNYGICGILCVLYYFRKLLYQQSMKNNGYSSNVIMTMFIVYFIIMFFVNLEGVGNLTILVILYIILVHNKNEKIICSHTL